MSWDVILTRCSNVDLSVEGGVVVDLDVGVGPDAEQLSQSLSTSATIMSCPTLLRCSTSTSTTSSRPLRSSACRPRSLLTSLFPVGRTTSEEFCAGSKCSDPSYACSEYVVVDSPTADFDDVHYPPADSEDTDYADLKYADSHQTDSEDADNDQLLAQDRHRAHQPAYRGPAVWS